MSHSSRYRTVDAWRGIASLGVVFFHSFGPYTRERVWAPLEPLRAISDHGWLGLHLFFVISGYCIWERLHLASLRRESAPHFWRDRAMRILPPYWGALAATLALNLLAWPFNRSHLADNIPLSWPVWIGNLTLTHALLGLPSMILVSWTLCCELAFYFVAGLLLLAGRGSRKIPVGFSVGALLCLPAFFSIRAHWALPVLLWPEFFLGVCVSFVLRTHQAALRGLRALGLTVMVALSASAVVGIGDFGGPARASAVILAWVLLALHPWDLRLARLPVTRALAWVGTFSYSLYLMHAPVLSRVLNLGSRFIVPSRAAFSLLWLFAVAAAIGGGWCFWRWVEQPCERYRAAWRARGKWAPAAASLPNGLDSAAKNST